MGETGLAAALRRHRRVSIDTAIFIYHLEASGPYAALATAALSALESGAFHGLTSVLTVMELAVKPLQLGRPGTADAYQRFLVDFPNLEIVVPDLAIARRAAELRATIRLTSADALQVATGLQNGATAFLTNDHRLRRVPDITILLLDDFVVTSGG